MPKVIYTGAIGGDHILDGLKWEPLDNGNSLSPELTEEQAARYLQSPYFREVKLPAAKPAPAVAAKKAPVKKTAAKPKGGA